MAELHAALAPGDLAETLRRVTDAAVELLPDVDGATITVEHEDHRLETAAATGPVDSGPGVAGDADAAAPDLSPDTASHLDHLQQALNEGPAVDVVDSSRGMDAFPGDEPGATGASAEGAPEPGAPREGEPGQAPAVRSSDLARDDRYPTYGVVAANSGVRAQVSVVLFDTGRARGVLTLYSNRPGAFDDTAVLTDLFAQHSATALAYAAEYDDRATSAPGLNAVGQALGIVMERFHLPETKAFALLQQTAERRRVSVRLVAQELLAHTEEAGSHV